MENILNISSNLDSESQKDELILQLQQEIATLRLSRCDIVKSDIKDDQLFNHWLDRVNTWLHNLGIDPIGSIGHRETLQKFRNGKYTLTREGNINENKIQDSFRDSDTIDLKHIESRGEKGMMFSGSSDSDVAETLLKGETDIPTFLASWEEEARQHALLRSCMETSNDDDRLSIEVSSENSDDIECDPNDEVFEVNLQIPGGGQTVSFLSASDMYLIVLHELVALRLEMSAKM